MRKILATTALAGAILAGLSSTADATSQLVITGANTCLSANLNFVSNAAGATLRARGWHAQPGDREARLWSPACPRTFTPRTHEGSPMVAGPFEDYSARYADGMTWDPTTGGFRLPR